MLEDVNTLYMITSTLRLLVVVKCVKPMRRGDGRQTFLYQTFLTGREAELAKIKNGTEERFVNETKPST